MTVIPFNAPEIAGAELEYVQRALASGHTSSGGPFSKQAGRMLAEATGAKEVLLTTSCTAALELSAMLLDLGPDDTVVVPSFTFTSSALAFARQGAKILFCDIEPETLGLDPSHLAELLDDSVRAVVLVHYAGIACDVDGVRRVLADRPDVVIVEDAAHGLYGAYHGEPLGGLGRYSSLSFHETKNFTCGEGGALLLHDDADVNRARVLYDKGTDRQAFFLGQVDKYSWRDTGSSFGISDLLAACLTAQLEQADSIQQRRRRVFTGYAEALADPAAELGVRLPVVPDACDPAWHLFYVLLPSAHQRPLVMKELQEQGIRTTFHYVPLHTSDGGRRFSARPTSCPVSSDISARLVRLPFYNTLTPEQVDRVATGLIDAVRSTS
ncbi:MAG TPA: dTDP-4-amino-4,6-dideoxygalactose transaminase [Ornithinimicrobium sp.]|uniref:dTDP-4-amino-4,6-dideoxygalactose transaminase n=1 Tax=Ornithinimicrobium sp. TaxID=1977084 RepID=UPI002B488B0C|nr:dTDP-4-amino-4,6-dideoxygalactose transaminase [Ornithinimicrobium sp.]HKJ10790.1 dTDP-4-amino-4,6-dideoxygalactose transaminase [Ornithinimicrobium sp.]